MSSRVSITLSELQGKLITRKCPGSFLPSPR